jgi:hypothetical protein
MTLNRATRVMIGGCYNDNPRIELWLIRWWLGDRSSTVVKVLRYKSEGRWFDPRWCHWNFSHRTMALGSTQPLREKWVQGEIPGGKCGRCVGLSNLPRSCVVVKKSGSLKFLELSGPLQACKGTALPYRRVTIAPIAPMSGHDLLFTLWNGLLSCIDINFSRI